MIVGQLWFGWSRRGVDGVDRQQIVAASGSLDDRAQAATRLVLRWCYRPDRPAFGWVEQGGVTVVFRRTPTGLDGHGRPGAFFVHALVAAPGTLDAAMLARLWSADVWTRRAPEDPPAKLPALTDPAELGLGPPPVVDEAVVRDALAGHLANLARGRRSALPAAEETAVALAARLAALLPARLGLPAFSTAEEGEQAEAYDLIAGPPPSVAFLPIGEESPGRLWEDAADLLLDAEAGGLVAATAEDASSHAELAMGLQAYAAIERASAPGAAAAEIPAATWAHIVGDPRRLARVVARAAPLLATAIVTGVPEAQQALPVLPSGADRSALAEALVATTAGLSTADGMRVLGTLAPAPHLAAGVARALLARWHADGRIAQLGPADVVALLRIQERGASTRDLDAASDALLGLRGVTTAIVDANDLPVAWRARAVARRPRHVSGELLVELLLGLPHFAELLLAERDAATLDAVGAAIAEVPAQQGYQTAQTLRMLVPAYYEGWLRSAVDRFPLERRHQVLQALLSGGWVSENSWAEAMLKAYVQLVLERRSDRGPLPKLVVQGVVRSSSLRADRWCALQERLSQNVRAATTRAYGAAVEAAALGGDDRDAAFELIVDAVTSWSLPRGVWQTAVQEVESRAAEPPETFVARVVRASTRMDRIDAGGLRIGTAIWIASGVENRHYDERLLEAPFLLPLIDTPLSKTQRKSLRVYADGFQMKPVRKWLEQVGRTRRGLTKRPLP
ncbi:MAG TPA: hypothetical protein VKB25_15935 [Conexibacter sp.]|nr:hypothetical protein [Conexibacter sp.]